MRSFNLSLFVMLSCAHLQGAELLINADFALERQWSASDATVSWIPSTAWTPELTSTFRLQHQGFEAAFNVTPEDGSLESLYQDISTDTLEWTIGIKAQEWAYAYSSEALNWLDEAPVVMTEYFLPAASVQTFCRFPDAQSPACGGRAYGWWRSTDWQLMAQRDEHWQLGAGLQMQIGLGGIAFAEGLYQEQADVAVIVGQPGLLSIRTQAESQWTLNTGLQWSWANGLSALYELSVPEHPWRESQWHAISDQLSTPTAGLLADAFDRPVPAQQHVLRLEQSWQAFQLEQVVVYWPTARQSWLSQTRAVYELNSRMDLSLEWEQHAPEGVFADIGAGQTVRLTLSISDGLPLNP